MKLFERFDETFLINLDRRKDRLEKFQAQVDKFNLGKFTRVSAIDGKTLNRSKFSTNLNSGALGLLLTNLEILRNSIEKKYNSILIIEDDCLFTDEVLKIQEYFDVLPNDWDMLYMGGNHNTHMNVPPPLIINDKVIKLHSTFTTHFVAFRKNVFEHAEIILSKFQNPIDMSYTTLQKIFKVYSFYPSIAKQIIDFSDIENKVTDYDWLIK